MKTSNLVLATGGQSCTFISTCLALSITGVARTHAQEESPDRNGPRLLSALVQETGTTNQIVVTFSEGLLASSASDTNHYTLHPFGATNTVPVKRAIYWPGDLPQSPSKIILLVGTNHWHLGGASNYLLTVRGVRDAHTNIIAPDSMVPVAWPRYRLLLPVNAEWHFYQGFSPETEVCGQNWTAPQFVENSSWMRGPGMFYSGFSEPPLNDCASPQTPVLVNPRRMFLRIPFDWPTNRGPAADLQFKLSRNHGDGMALHLNGSEVLRESLLERAPTPIPCTTQQCCVIVEFPYCPTFTVTVTNLVPGLNWLAADAFQRFTSDVLFGCEVTEIQSIPGPLPANPPPTLAIRRAGSNAFGLTWTGLGYALESTTNLSSQPPVWMEVPDMSNPYTHIADESPRFYRLWK